MEANPGKAVLRGEISITLQCIDLYELISFTPLGAISGKLLARFLRRRMSTSNASCEM